MFKSFLDLHHILKLTFSLLAEFCLRNLTDQGQNILKPKGLVTSMDNKFLTYSAVKIDL